MTKVPGMGHFTGHGYEARVMAATVEKKSKLKSNSPRDGTTEELKGIHGCLFHGLWIVLIGNLTVSEFQVYGP
ncbi:hypothetical protein HAX54_020249, partial [Datura stramonium]|nr:hypothetical protein [Datura stramonium]